MLRLATGAEDEIDHHVKLLSPEFGLMVLKELPIPQNLFRAVRYVGFAAMENCDLMAAFAEAVEPRIVR